ncbi:hypothetical protein D9756_002931 [Leucocoprinus leucothites]|uniref:Mucoidy inhibitor A n=1 Tax=Leucocoprinus leucothites TaxID=201217 RepID=A0A8H5G6V7_9AGAR|nr:hypothetical protein D9756_002931 [Leucoagaricus leucothites]
MLMDTIQIVASDHPITSVMILKSSKAEISRSFNVSLKEGRNKVTIKKLPRTIDVQSVRLSILNSDGAPSENTHLSGTVCSVSDAPSYDPSKSKLYALEIERSGLLSEKKLLDMQAEVMVTYARTWAGERTGIKDIDTFLDAFRNKGRKSIEAAMKIEEQMAELDSQIQEERRKNTLVKGSINTELGIVIVADNDTQIQLNLTYLVNNTKWTPTYELHVVTGEDGKPSSNVSLHYHASIKQATGEDWTDASLMLSTATADVIVRSIPTLEPVKICGPAPPSVTTVPGPATTQPDRSRPPRRNRSPSPSHNHSPSPPSHNRSPTPRRVRTLSPLADRSYYVRPSSPIQAPTMIIRHPSPQSPPQTVIIPSSTYPDSSSFIVAPDLQSLQETPPDDVLVLSDDEDTLHEGENAQDRTTDIPTKLATQTPMTLTYAVRGKVDISSDGKNHTVTIAILTFKADIEYISIPRVDPRVFLQYKVKNDSAYRLLPGPVSVILDNNYVSRTKFTDLNRNDTFTFTLGDDPSITISYECLTRIAKEGTHKFAEAIDITTYATTVTAQNTHPFAVENLIIRDAVPMSGSDERFKVLLRKPEELVGAKEGEFVEVKDSSDAGVEESNLLVKWEKEQDGLYEYKWKIDANDTVKLETVFDVKAPSDITYLFSNFGIHSKA